MFCVPKILAHSMNTAALSFVIPFFDTPDGAQVVISEARPVSGEGITPLDHALAEAGLRVAQYIHENAFHAVLMSGLSAPLSYALLRLSWRALYPHAQLPPVHILSRSENYLLYRDIVHVHSEEQRKVLVQSFLGARYPMLFAERDRRICYLDDVVVDGHKHQRLRKRFPRYGFSRMSYVYIAAKEKAATEGVSCLGVSSNAAADLLLELGTVLQGDDMQRTLSERREFVASFLQDVNEALQGKGLPQ